ncbi:MAG: hypothetical protein WCP21_22665 [Armatimonadota bacterium]
MLTVWQQGDWAVECDPDGGRLTRIAWRGRDLLTRPHLPGGVFTPPDPKWGEFETRPVFGYDDCWPSLEISVWPDRDQPVRDHGELCWRRWSVTPTELALHAAVSEPGDWTFARDLSCPDGALRFDFAVTNTGDRPLTMSWAGHALLPPGALRGLVLPECEAITQEFPEAGEMEMQLAEAWPYLAALPRGAAVMLVLRHCHTPEFTVALDDDLRWRVGIEGARRPSLGLWYNHGGYPPQPGLERTELGLEWLLTPECVLKQAAQSGSAIVLAPREKLRWVVIWSIEEKP